MQVVTEVNLPGMELFSRGKVRDMYDLGNDSLLIVTTDRMSAFDVIMGEPIPYKGVVLNQITLFWMQRFANRVNNHLLVSDFTDYPASLQPFAEILKGRSVIVKKAHPLPVECIVRGYLAGSGWAEYKKHGTVCGQALPAGLMESSKLPAPIFTPSTKADLGEHDENINDEQAIKLLGADLFHKVKNLSIDLFNAASSYAESHGIIIADTKFEFGMIDGELTLIDEVLTPDSSRFWPQQGYSAGKSQPSFDKQFLRDWLSKQDWNQTAPAPALPKAVIDETASKYNEAYAILTGTPLPGFK